MVDKVIGYVLDCYIDLIKTKQLARVSLAVTRSRVCLVCLCDKVAACNVRGCALQLCRAIKLWR